MKTITQKMKSVYMCSGLSMELVEPVQHFILFRRYICYKEE
jgi:hypothetical protein